MGCTSATTHHMIAAALDIGTNTLLLTVAAWPSNKLQILVDEHRIARLGEGIGQYGYITHTAVERAQTIIAEYRDIVDRIGVQHRIAVGTSVFRRAANAHTVATTLAETWGAPITIISGEQEAMLTYYGTVTSGGDGTVLDIGGGSTELVQGSSDSILAKHSFEIGAVILAERYWGKFPAPSEAVARAWEEVTSLLTNVEPLPAHARFYAVAGTPTTLALMAQNIQEYNWKAVDGYILTRAELNRLWDRIASASYQELLSLPGVHPQRADILPAGTLILRAFVERLHVAEITVSTRGLRHGILRCYFEAIAQHPTIVSSADTICQQIQLFGIVT